MNRLGRAAARITVIAVVAGSVALVVSATPAQAAPRCADRVVTDWSDNGRIDGLYALECYEAAIDAIPVDLRDYTNAADVIARALTAASREQPPSPGGGALASPASGPAGGSSSDDSVPLPLVVAVVFSLVVLTAGTVGYVTRRQRGAH